MNLKLKISLIVLSLLLMPLPRLAYSVEVDQELKEKINLQCNKNLSESFIKVKEKFSKSYEKKFKSIDKAFDNGQFPIFDIQTLFDSLKRNVQVPVRSSNPFNDLNNKIENCKISLVKYYQEEYVKTCVEDKEDQKECKKKSTSSARWFNNM